MAEMRPGENVQSPQIGQGLLFVVAISLLTNPASVVGVIAPTIIDLFVAKGFPLATASLLGAVEMAGMTIALLCGPIYLKWFDRRVLACLAAGTAAAGQVLSIIVPYEVLIGAFRAITGAGEGAHSSSVVSIAAPVIRGTRPVPYYTRVPP